jgi:hypothetical protein
MQLMEAVNAEGECQTVGIALVGSQDAFMVILTWWCRQGLGSVAVLDVHS